VVDSRFIASSAAKIFRGTAARHGELPDIAREFDDESIAPAGCGAL
jgi:hypothetical protein